MSAPSLLIIEDDPYVRRFYQRLFELNHMQVALASSGSEGITQAKLLKPRLIFLDIMMPEINGLEVLKRLKGDPETSGIEVIILTNYGDASNVSQAIQLGASGVMLKANTTETQLLSEVEKHKLPDPPS